MWKQLVGISKTIATYRKYEVTRRHLAEFIRSKLQRIGHIHKGDKPDVHYRF